MQIFRSGQPPAPALPAATESNNAPKFSWRRRQRRRFLWPAAVVLVSLLWLAAAGISIIVTKQPPGALFVTSFVVVPAFGIVALAMVMRRVRIRLLNPMSELHSWAERVHGGNYAARIDTLPGDLASLSRLLNDLGDELRSLNLEMAARVRRHTLHLARKTRSLEILYDIASTLSTSRTIDSVLENFLDAFVQLFDARAAMVRLLNDKGEMRLVASRGLDPQVIEREKLMPVNRCLCGHTAVSGNTQVQKGSVACTAVLGMPLLKNDCRELVAVPIRYQDKTLGVYNLVLDKPLSDFGDDLGDLLTSIGRHLGMAVEKAHLDDDARRLAIIEERNMIGNELHDSLAQSLVSMRLHVKLLGETLYKKDLHSAQNETRRLQTALEEAHTSLRELLANFRSRMDERGLVPAIENMVMRFQEETGIAAYFQNECREVILTPAQEVQVFRIVQEALANIRKHSEAHTARILLRGEGQDRYHLLIEDDGLGMSTATPAQRGEHVGLDIMRERAERLGGQLTIESESGEGTRVSLNFSTTPPARAAEQAVQ